MPSLCMLDSVRRDGKHSMRVRELARTKTTSSRRLSITKSPVGPDLKQHVGDSNAKLKWRDEQAYNHSGAKGM